MDAIDVLRAQLTRGLFAIAKLLLLMMTGQFKTQYTDNNTKSEMDRKDQ